MILGKDPKKAWTRHDFLLLEAWQIVQDEKCGQCGLPVWICHTSDNRVEFTTGRDECSVQVVVEKARDKLTTGKNKKPPVGVQIYPEYFLTGGATVWEVRKEFYEDEGRKYEAVAAERGIEI